MDTVELCNLALAMAGQARKITSLDEVSPEAEACKLLFKPTLDICLEACNWSFARRDEVIDEQNYLPDVVALPYEFAYELPSDVMRVLALQPIKGGPFMETMAMRDGFQFNFRNYDNKKILATDKRAPFAVQYQCYLDDISICTPSFCDAMAYVLGGKLCTTLIRGVDGMNIGSTYLNMGMARLQQAAAFDAQQGNYAIDNHKWSSFIKARQ